MKKLILMCSMFIGMAAVAHSSAINSPTPDPVLKAKGLQKELKLTDKQTDKVAAIYKESADKYEKIKADEHGNSDKMLPKIAPLRTATIKKIKAVLTPAQTVKYDKLINEPNKSATYGGWSDGWSASPASN
jgi:periplasmic protein CpxP/Spy